MVRPATAADIAALVDLVTDVHRLHLNARPGGHRDPSPAEIAAALARMIADPDVAVRVADRAGSVVGYVIVHRVDPPDNIFAASKVKAYVGQLGVRPDARGTGHGRLLMAAAEEVARGWGADAVTLDVQSFNAEALAFYEALGYAVTGHRMARSLAG
jgi:ribosomal protein S18 acetylase RimI-like enzyme